MKFPKTRQGWKTLFWLTLRRCPIDHAPLTADPWVWWKREPVLYCLTCGGWAIWPRGFFEALRQNARAKQ